MTTRNETVAARIRAHHDAMARELDGRLDALVAAVRRGEPYRPALENVLQYVRQEILPHAAAEEETLYAAASRREAGRALVKGLTAEHGTIQETLRRLEGAGDALEAVALASALTALFISHAAEENDALLPVLMEEPAEDLEALLEGMHERLTGAALEAGGEAGTSGGAAAEEDGTPELDVRALPPFQRHQLIFATYEAMRPGQAFILVNDHDPKPLYYQFAAEHPGAFEWEYLEQGPEAWRVRIGKV
ncbi:DUF2249 domain-containing protein [Thermaerobacter sp. PB12/4term]|uniref:DUF2249 domain-containing protein n=1 Tax=Thermaerobacter sp. PB12/4term TaxID=2293838 RepID=UPI000E32ACFA|nr:DUF2249 domain-containing protein [Thermaerobacter sp. PB12/4term]QIA27404.1 DUF2249 domain-containing protein [Thermaerobacter sp. PB12/4term]